MQNDVRAFVTNLRLNHLKRKEKQNSQARFSCTGYSFGGRFRFCNTKCFDLFQQHEVTENMNERHSLWPAFRAAQERLRRERCCSPLPHRL